MHDTPVTPARPQGRNLTKAERDDLIVSIVTRLQKGYASNYRLARDLKVNDRTIQKLRPMADAIITEQIPDRGIIRSLEIAKTYEMVAYLADLLEKEKDHKRKMDISRSMLGWSKHMALITGLNVETKINVNQKQLVITRAHPDAVKKALNGDNDVQRIQAESEQVIKNL